MLAAEPFFAAGGRIARGLVELSDDLAALERPGFWAVLVEFEGRVRCARFADVRSAPLPSAPPWTGPRPTEWRSSLDRAAYLRAVETIRGHIGAGTVYQANLCRVLRAPLPDPGTADVLALAAALARGNPAPHAAVLRLPSEGVHVAGASPELYLRRSGDLVESGPIKGTAAPGQAPGEKDRAENVMIVDLVRNDLGRVCDVGSVTVPELCALQEHPGLVHLVSTVRGRLAPWVGWAELIAATFPPGSVTGAPKLAALEVIAGLESVPRGPYCGALGWVDSARGSAELAVGIRTFWFDGGDLCFGTGAGITWGSDPETEWAETELKAARLLRVAGGAVDRPSGAGAGAAVRRGEARGPNRTAEALR
ncbi:MAG: chorismate-binding protein [Sporichthyaceae bacterium]